MATLSLANPMAIWNKLKYLSFLPATTCLAMAYSAESSSDRAELFSILSFILIIVTVPLTHYCMGKRKDHGFYFYHPFVGGGKYVLLQAIGWAVYSINALLCIVKLVVYSQIVTNVTAHIPLSLPATGNVIALLFVISSFFYFESESLPKGNNTQRSRSSMVLMSISMLPIVIFSLLMLSANNYVSWITACMAIAIMALYIRYKAYSMIKQVSIGWNNIGVLGLVLVSLSLIFAMCVEFLATSGKQSLVIYINAQKFVIPSSVFALLATSFFLVAVPLTHGVAGKQKCSGYKSFQPFFGGTRFVFLQGLGWAVYSLSAMLAVYVISRVFNYYSSLNSTPVLPADFAGLTEPQVVPYQGLLASMTAGGFFSQCLVLISLFYFDPENAKSRSNMKWRFNKLQKAISPFWTCSILYAIHWIWLFSCLAILFFLPLKYSAAILVAFHAPYLFTFRNEPHHTGHRKWPTLREQTWLFDSMQDYFSGRMIQTSNTPLDPKEKYMIGFHPHGIYPVTVYWATLGRDWRKLNPKIDVTTLGATVMFYTPFMRDVISWFGTRDVGRRTMEKLLDEGNSVLLLPGGQAEMLYAGSEQAEVVVSRKHKGFVRLAIQKGAAVVPMFSFGENEILDNIGTKKIQRWFVKYLRLNPHFPYGRWFLPIPRPAKVTVILGDPIHVEKQDNPSEEYIDDIHEKYFAHLQEIFEKHKEDAGYPNLKLKFADAY